VRGNLAGTDPDNPLAIGVDIGGTAIKAAIVGVRGDLLKKVREPSPRSASALRDFALWQRETRARHVLGRAFEYLAAAMSFLHTFDSGLFILGGNIAAAQKDVVAPAAWPQALKRGCKAHFAAWLKRCLYRNFNDDEPNRKHEYAG
jgi:predicted NBD/HSP70 family sugar kinase